MVHEDYLRKLSTCPECHAEVDDGDATTHHHGCRALPECGKAVTAAQIRPRKSQGCGGLSEGILGVQACTAGDLSKRQAKALADVVFDDDGKPAVDKRGRPVEACGPKLRVWLRAGGRFQLHGWAKRGPRGKRKLWMVSRREVVLRDGSFEVSDSVKEAE